ncbi:hypothetical protein LZ575_05070 [Antarcticibacterium sp. 1MA-6-2]|uniref:hypothetical protein n=1 Tax=Antarcticibacterium sp. 1MA-6-2 TaxID=2908210 RepID=UPI001F41BA2E|nr:hypothetical protein [Antarcticibacterium sp. 1MA-6-2]UJH92000.1 hypothetical protein LZ575_05070 [Antarcticibacterium sp. 1MA-6-2]
MSTKDRNTNKHLFYLNELSDYKVASHDPDVRGWQVKDKDNRVIGKVDNLLVNKVAERVVYLDVEVDKTIIEADHDPYGKSANNDIREFINKEGENHIIIPVGLVSLNNDQKFVYTDQIDHRTFAETKRYEKGTNVNREYEVVVLESYDRRNDRISGDSGSSLGDRTTTGTTSRSTFNDDDNFDRTGDTFSSDRDRNRAGKDTFSDDRDFDRTSGTTGSTFSDDRDRTRTERSSEDKFSDDREYSRTSGTTGNRFDEDKDISRTGSTYGHDRNDNDSGISDRDRNDDYRSDRDRRHSDDDFYERREFNGSHFRRNR